MLLSDNGCGCEIKEEAPEAAPAAETFAAMSAIFAADIFSCRMTIKSTPAGKLPKCASACTYRRCVSASHANSSVFASASSWCAPHLGRFQYHLHGVARVGGEEQLALGERAEGSYVLRVHSTNL